MRTSVASPRGWVLFLTLTFGGCALASATGYQPTGSDGGYSELQLAPDMYRIAFQGNTYTSQERVADMALLRAAELALAQGAPYFVVLKPVAGVPELPEHALRAIPVRVVWVCLLGPRNCGDHRTGPPR